MSPAIAKRCGWHKPDQLGYVAAGEDADRRIAAGERQRRCQACRHYFWLHEWGLEP